MEQLIPFVKEALAKGHSREEVRAALLDAGWPGDEVDDALSRFADVPFPIPVPRRRASGSAKEAFLFLITFIALYTCAFAFGTLVFALIEAAFPDPISDDRFHRNDEYRYGPVRWSIASLIVAFPLYMVLTRMHLKSFLLEPERRTSSVRRWLTYLTLVVAVSVILGSLITLIANLLGGEIAPRFILRTLTVLGIAAAVGLYYSWELRISDAAKKR